MKRKLIFILLAALLLTPWPVAYAYDDALAGQTPIQIEATGPETAPELNAFGHAIGGVSPGDLFIVDSTNIAPDIPLTLYITNTDELVQHYRYMNLNISIYAQTGSGQWEKVTTGEGAIIPDIYLTMDNGKASFTLPGCGKYKITIDKGCFYCYGTVNGKSAIPPTFYLTTG